MKVVIDTNVFISGIFFSGPPYKILNAWRNKAIQIVISPEILDEYFRVGTNLNKKFNQIDIEEFIDLLTVEAELTQAPKILTQICKDPDDDRFIACALAAKSKVIISGDKHLLDVDG